MSSIIDLPPLPRPVADFLKYVKDKPNVPIAELVGPYREFDSKIRQVFAQNPNDPLLSDQNVNIVPLYGSSELGLKIESRNLESESIEDKEKYILPLKPNQRRSHRSAAMVDSLKQFRNNFNIFTELSLSEMDWNNVVVAGSAVNTSLIPVPEEHGVSKRALRKYYHEQLAPASDVDLFLYGLDEKQAIQKIKDIERSIRDAIIQETTTIRTKNAVTIVSQYPTRHVQIVLRVYKSISEILTGFDVDCSCVAYDGKQVYAAPRAIAAFVTQINTIDLTRRSPSYENRLSKYSHRGFEVYWPQLDRSRIDPTIFEQNFRRSEGLARLLVLESLPTAASREAYSDQRRRERGRPPVNRYLHHRRQLRGNLKNDHEDEIADWIMEDAVSDYHTFAIPYGQRWTAKRIERVLYSKDLLLNAEWNKPKDREVHLHRHPAFFGLVEDVLEDCCGFCPKPHTPEEQEIAAEEGKRFVSGPLTLMKDDPGRQAIGSFNPITSDDWTDMAYVNDTEALCRAIVDQDIAKVQKWLADNKTGPNRRDYTGRTPLQLAVASSTTEIVQCLVDAGARMVARMADGRTALHIAAAEGRLDVVRLLLIRSEANGALEEEKIVAKALSKAKSREGDTDLMEIVEDDATTDAAKSDINNLGNEEEEDFDEVMGENSDSGDVEVHSQTTSSFVKVDRKAVDPGELPTDEETDDPDVFDIDVVAWDTPVSALHLAIMHGHADVVQELVQSFGADVLMPVKTLGWNGQPEGAIMTLNLALRVMPLEKAKAMAATLLKLGATSAQANMKQQTVLQSYANGHPEMLQTLIDIDGPAVRKVLNHLAISGQRWNLAVLSPLITAINSGNSTCVTKLLDIGAKPSYDVSDFLKSYNSVSKSENLFGGDMATDNFMRDFQQPLAVAIQREMPLVAIELLRRGASPDTLMLAGQRAVLLKYPTHGEDGIVLDAVTSQLEKLRAKETKLQETIDTGNSETNSKPYNPFSTDSDEFYLTQYPANTYRYWHATLRIKAARELYKESMRNWEETSKDLWQTDGSVENLEAIRSSIRGFESLREELLSRGAKSFADLHKDLEGTTKIPTYYPRPDHPPFEARFTFNKSNLTPEAKEAYIKIFDAAWAGDLEIIKTYTLGRWGVDHGEPPLEIAISDSHGLSPFTIALLRGHQDVAKAVLEIAKAQHVSQVDTHEGKIYEVGSDLLPDLSDSDDESDVFFSRPMDPVFTIDNIGEVASEVKSSTHPYNLICYPFDIEPSMGSSILDNLDKAKVAFRKAGGPLLEEYLGRPTIFEVAVMLNDMKMLQWLLALYMRYVRDKHDEHKQLAQMRAIRVRLFDFAIKVGRTEMVTELIKTTGAGLPIEDIIKDSGVEVTKEKAYYTGLTVYGKKRPEWAKKPSRRWGGYSYREDRLPPLLTAAMAGSVESVEYFLSDTPRRCYAEFAEAKQNWSPIKALRDCGEDFDSIVAKYLDQDSHLALHCATLSAGNTKKYKVIEYFASIDPEACNVKTDSGYTPLHLAFMKGDVEAAKMLIAHGGVQTCRDKKGANIVHTMLQDGERRDAAKVADNLRSLLELVDKNILPTLFTQRISDGPGAQTPLHYWLSANRQQTKDDVKVLEVLLDYSNGAELGLINGAGNTPLHDIVAKQNVQYLEAIAKRYPDMLHRENASGRTPADIVADQETANKLHEDSLDTRYNQYQGMVARAPMKFRPSKRKEEEWADAWQSALARTSGKRKLATLSEANEVAKRLTAKQAKEERQRKRARRFHPRVDVVLRGGDEVPDSEEDDVLSRYYFSKDPRSQ